MSFSHESTTDDVLQGLDLTGKHVVVTGASGGLGAETARALASKGASVVLASRNLKATEAQADSIRQSTGNEQVMAVALDLADLDSVRSAAEEIKGIFPKLDILINNAGIMAVPLDRTVQGFESQFGICHIGHFLLTNLLLDSLKAAGKARVVSLTSGGHKIGTVNLEDPNFETREYEKWDAYGAAKTANAQFAVGFNARYQSEGITANAVHPGMIMTDLSRHLTQEDIEKFMQDQDAATMMSQMKMVPQGAATSVWAATSPELEGKGGLYLEDCQVGVKVEEGEPTHGYYDFALNAELSEQLWVKTEALIATVS